MAGTQNGPIQRVLFIQYPEEAIAKTEGSPGSFGASGSGVLCPDYKYTGHHWANPSGIDYSINPAGSGVSSDTTISSLRASFDTWGDACGPLSFSYQGTTGAQAGLRDGANVVSWGDLSDHPGAIAVTSHWINDNNEILEADTQMDISLAWSYTPPNVSPDLSEESAPLASRYPDPTNAGDSGTYDIRAIMTHEAGHWLNLGDLEGGTQSELTMYGYGGPGQLKDDTLGYGDELGVESIYTTRTICLTTSGLAPSSPAVVHYLQGGVLKSDSTCGTWTASVDGGSVVSIDSMIPVSSTERYSTAAETSWIVRQSATYTIPYYHQYKTGISAVMGGATQPDPDAANQATLTYYQYGSAATFDISDIRSFNDWVDSGSLASLVNLTSASTSTHRWYAPGTPGWTIDGPGTKSMTYREQFKAELTLTGLSPSCPATIRAFQDGTTNTLTASDSWSDWVDSGSALSVSGDVPVSSEERCLARDKTSWFVRSPVAASVQYGRQFRVSVDISGLQESRPVNLTFVQGERTNNLLASDGWSDWVDMGSTVAADRSVEGGWMGDFSSGDSTSWTVDSALSVSIRYQRSFAGLYVLAGALLAGAAIIGIGAFLLRRRRSFRARPPG